MDLGNLIQLIAYIFVIVGLLVYYLIQRKKQDPLGKEGAFVALAWVCIFAVNLATGLSCYLSDTGRSVLLSIGNAIQGALKPFALSFDLFKAVEAKYWSGGVIAKIYTCFTFAMVFVSSAWTYYVAVVTFFKSIYNRMLVFIHRNPVILLPGSIHYIVIGNGRTADVFLKNLSESKRIRDDITVIIGKTEKDRSSIFKEYINRGYAVIGGEADEDSLKAAGIQRKRKTVVVSLSEYDSENVKVAKLVTAEILNRLPDDIREQVSSGKELKDIPEQILERIPAEYDKISLEARILYGTSEHTDLLTFVEKAGSKVAFFNLYDLRARSFFQRHPLTHRIYDLIDETKGRLRGTLTENDTILKDENDDKSEYKIKHIFIGFGAGNRQMLRSSIMFNQFYGCRYHAAVYANDTDVSDDRMIFEYSAPDVFSSAETAGKEYYEKYEYDVRFAEKVNVFDKKFYESVIRDEIAGADYADVFIALGDDRLDIETAIELRRMIQYFRSIVSCKVDIFVKVRDNDSFVKDEFLPQDESVFIEAYGQDEEILSVDAIVTSVLDELSNGVLSNQDHRYKWVLMKEYLRSSNRMKLMNMRNMLGLIKMDLVTSDKRVADALGIEYVDADTIRCIEERGMPEFYGAYFGSEERKREIKTLSVIMPENIAKEEKNRLAREYESYCIRTYSEDNARNNLAKAEHLRWNSFHDANGWTRNVKGSKKNEATKQHPCITTIRGLLEYNRDVAGEGNENKGVLRYDFTMFDRFENNLDQPQTRSISLIRRGVNNGND